MPALQQDLRDLLTEDLPAALQALKEFLPENGEKQGQVLAFSARLKDANKERFRNTISPDDYQRRVDTIRAECFDLIAGLEEADFEAPQPGSAKASAGKQGSVLYRVPHQMPVRKPTICTVRVAMDEDAILEDIVLDDDVRVRPRVEVSDMMRAELLDPEGEVFAIRPLSEVEQLVRQDGYTQWLFSVTPRVAGQHQLLVKVSMMEFNKNLNKYVPREVSILETVTIITEAPVPADPEETPLKATGERFALGPATLEDQPAPAPSIMATHTPMKGEMHGSVEVVQAPKEMEPEPPQIKSGNTKGLRAAALFLAFLMLGTSATWALTPAPTRDWWLASLRDNEEAYDHYIEKYDQDSSNEYLETAYFRRAELSGMLSDLRAYQERFSGGRFENIVNEKIRALENKALDYIRRDPTVHSVRQFVREYYDSERFDQVKQAVDTRAELRAELHAELEDAYLRSVQANPTKEKIMGYLREYPQSERLSEVAQAAASRPEVLGEVQPAIEQAILARAQAATLPAQLENLLPALESLDGSAALDKMQEIVAQKPQLKKEMMPQLRGAAERVRDLKEKHLSQNDTDGDGVPDKDDRCPNDKGDAGNNGCPK